MLVNVFIRSGILHIGTEKDVNNSYCTSEISLNEEILKEYEENSSYNKKYIKDEIKLKEGGFTSDEIIELIGDRNV